jgi:hypothetical protein
MAPDELIRRTWGEDAVVVGEEIRLRDLCAVSPNGRSSAGEVAV